MTVETKSLNINPQDEVEMTEMALNQESEIIELGISTAEVISWNKTYEIISNYLKTNYGLDLTIPDIKDYLDDVKTTVSVRFRKNKKTNKIEPIFINSSISNPASALQVRVRCSTEIVLDGEFFILLDAKQLNSKDNQELGEALFSKIKEVKDESELLEKDEDLISLEEEISNKGVLSVFKEQVIQKMKDNSDLNTEVICDNKNIKTVGELAIFILQKYTIPCEVFKDFLNSIQDVPVLNNSEFYFDYIKNNEHIFWNPEEFNSGVFRLLSSTEMKKIILERYKESESVKVDEETAKNIHQFIKNGDFNLVSSMVNNLEEIYTSNYGKNHYSKELTEIMNRFLPQEESDYKFSAKGFIIVEDVDLANFSTKLVSDPRINLNEDLITWMYNNLNTDVSSCKYPSFSLKENLDTLLVSLIQRETCPDNILRSYFFVSPEVGEIILDNPKLERNDNLVEDIYLLMKRKLDENVENEKLLNLYLKMKKFPYLSGKLSTEFGENLISYAYNLRETQESEKLDEEWRLIFNYKPNSIAWPHPFSIEGKRTELLNIIVKNVNSSDYVMKEYEMVFGSEDKDYQEAILRKLAKDGISIEAFSGLSISTRISLLETKLKEVKSKEERDIIEQMFSSVIKKELINMFNESTLGNLISQTKKLSSDDLINAFPNVVEDVKEEFSDEFFGFLKDRGAKSTNPAELDLVVSLLRGEVKDKRQYFISTAMTKIDDQKRNTILQYVTNNNVYKVGDLNYFLTNTDKPLTSLVKYEDVFERELKQIEGAYFDMTSRDLESEAKNLKTLFILKESQVRTIQSDINSWKNKVKEIIIAKTVSFIEECTDEDILEEKLNLIFNVNSMGSVLDFEELSLEVIRGITLAKEDIEPVVEAFIRNRHTPYNLKANLRTGFWGEVSNAPILLAI